MNRNARASSKSWPETLTANGLLGQFDYAQVAYVFYCTSDAHVANSTLVRAPGSDPAEWQFRGKVVTEAALKFLEMRGLGTNKFRDVKSHELKGDGEGEDGENGRGTRQRLIFSGGSSGGRGAMWLYEDVKAKFPSVEVLGIFDSPLWSEQPTYEVDFLFGLGAALQRRLERYFYFSQGGVSLSDNVRLFVDSFGDSLTPSIFGEDCLDYYRGKEKWKCLLGEYRL